MPQANTEIQDEIDKESGSCLCALCDNAVEEWEEVRIVKAHGNQYLCHAACCEDA